MARSHRRIWIYVGREYVLSFAVAFLFFFFLFFVNQILVMAEQIFAKKVPLWDVVRLVLYSFPIVIAFAFPFGALLGALMSVGRLSSDNESLAMGALGVPPRQILYPLLILGVVFSLVSFVMNDYFMPLSNIRFVEIYRRILYSNPAVELEPYSVRRYQGSSGDVTLVVGASEGAVIHDLLILDRSPEGNRRLITASSASLDQSGAQQGVIFLTLQKVFTQVSFPRDGDRFDYTYSDSMRYSLLLKNITSVSVGGLNPSAQSSLDVWKQIKVRLVDQQKALASKAEQERSLRFALAGGARAAEYAVSATPALAALQRPAVDSLWRQYAAEASRDVTDRTLQSYEVEFYRKFSMPAACLVFSFFAFPVGQRARRSGRTVGFAVGLFVAIAYWGLLVAGQTFGVRMSLSPAFSMWFPDVLVLAIGATLLLARLRQ